MKFVENSLIKNLEEGTVKLPDGYDPATKKVTGELIDVPIKDLGVSRVWLVQDKPLRKELIDPNAQLAAEGGAQTSFDQALGLDQQTVPGAAEAEAAAPPDPNAGMIEVQRYDFVVQFCWQPKTRSQRREIAAARAEAEAAAEEAEAAAAPEEVAMDGAAAQ
jgi:hypothetical protein